MRLIDADALTDELIRESEADTSKSIQTSFAKSVCLLLCKALELQQTVDAVPVIRCKDCKHRDPEDKKCDCGHTIRWQLPRSDEWFCADAERRGEGWKK